jgi:hypothetical protein
MGDNSSSPHARTNVDTILTHLSVTVSFNPLPLLFKTLLHGQKDRVFSRGHLNFRTTPETGLPSGGKKS